MEQLNRRTAIKDAADFMFKSQGYVDMNLLAKTCPFPDFYLDSVLTQEGYHVSPASPSQYTKKAVEYKGPVKVDLYLECFGPKTINDSSIGKLCVVCDEEIKVGDYTTLLSLGPGKDKIMRERAASQQSFKPVVKEAHWACTLGQVLEDPDAGN